jgi:hypothetical protein
MGSFDDVLALCLTDIEAGQASVDDCLRRFPQHATRLGPLLRTALAVRAAPQVEPSPAFRAAAPTRLQNMIAARPQPARQSWTVARPVRRWSILLARVAAVVIIASLFVGGTAYAARDSLPGSPLYPVKRTVEKVQVAVTPNDVRRARVFVGLMDQRAVEIGAMLRSGNAERAREASMQYAIMLREAEAVAERLSANRPEARVFLNYMRERLQAQQTMFMRLQSNTPERLRPLIRPALTNNQRTLDRINVRLESPPGR